MSGYEYVRAMRSLYNPRTPRAALVAAEAGILPAEAVVFKASSVKSLFEEPYDLEELERVLAQRDLSFADAMMLAEIFTTMTRETDKERALFAAESLTSLENRWARRVQALRAAYREEGGDWEPAFHLARAVYEQAMVAGRSAPIRNYYLLEAYHILSLRPEAGAGGPGFSLLIRCLVQIGLLEQAEALVKRGLLIHESGELIALAVEIAYMRKDIHQVRSFLAGRDLASLDLGKDLLALMASWQGLEEL